MWKENNTKKYYTQNKTLLDSLQSATADAVTCSQFDDTSAVCSGGDLGFLYSTSNGNASAGASNGVYCRIDYYTRTANCFE